MGKICRAKFSLGSGGDFLENEYFKSVFLSRTPVGDTQILQPLSIKTIIFIIAVLSIIGSDCVRRLCSARFSTDLKMSFRYSCFYLSSNNDHGRWWKNNSFTSITKDFKINCFQEKCQYVCSSNQERLLFEDLEHGTEWNWIQEHLWANHSNSCIIVKNET